MLLYAFVLNLTGGHIRVYVDNKAKPIVDVFDPFTLKAKYISFASEHGASNEFLYNCVSDKTTLDQSDETTKPVPADPDNLSLLPLDRKPFLFFSQSD